jgi:oligoribonuclease NrnB/cAMP/cGMP phosphodiesterase (DHH superfamily)
MKKTHKHVVISHADDLDGVASAILLSHYIQDKFLEKPEIKFANYDNVNDIVGESAKYATHLWISDLSIRNCDLVNNLRLFDADHLFFFDHHMDTQPFVDAIKDQATVCFHCTGEKCAADLIWEYMLQNMSMFSIERLGVALGHLVRATHSRDLWVNDVEEGSTLSAVIAMLGPDTSYQHLMEDITRVHRDNFTVLMNFCIRVADDSVTKAKNTANATKCRHFYRPDSPLSKAAGLTVITAYTFGCQSEVGDMFLQENSRTMVGLVNLEKLTLSFRTTQDVIQALGFGVNEIAKTIEGGGGHTYAAGAPANSTMLMGGPTQLMSLMTRVIDEKLFALEGIKTR